MLNLQKTTFKDHLLREISDEIEDINFTKDMNKAIYMLPIKNKKIFNMITNETIDRTILDKFDYECDAEYLNNMSQEQEQKVKKYFMDLFCEKDDPKISTIEILCCNL
jgi:hypothetical protein